jgi:3-oxoacyl-(acyl-carrier-protein) synthase
MTHRPAVNSRRVVVTGMGMITALGTDVASSWDGLVAGRSGIRTIEAFDPSRLTSRIAAEVRDFDPSGVLDRRTSGGPTATSSSVSSSPARRSTRPACRAGWRAPWPSGRGS